VSGAVYDTIRNTVQAYLPDARVLLFGSRARGDYDRHSDYDLLVVTKQELTQKEKLSWSSKMHRAIVKAIHAPIDLLLYTEEEISKKQELPGHIIRTAIREGVAL